MLTQERLKELFHYDPLTGLFTRKITITYNSKAGDVAKSIDSHGYIRIAIDGKRYKAHRLAFLYMENWLPEHVDHDDHIRINNKWKNLNAANNLTNHKNMSMQSRNKSGFTGVHKSKNYDKWIVQIRNKGKTIHIGSFAKKEDALKARKAANIKYNYHPNHGL